MSATNDRISVGVQELIEKLRTQGVSSGREEADRILTDARNEADAIVADAKKEAEAVIATARKEAEFTVKSGEEALQLAGRNSVLELKDFLLKQFSEQIRQTVSRDMADQGLLQKMILEVAGRNNLRGEENLEVVLPQQVVGVEDLRENPEETAGGYFTVLRRSPGERNAGRRC